MNERAPDRQSLSTALQGTPVTIFLQDVDGRFRWFENEQSVWARGDLVGLRDDNVLEPGSVAVLRDARHEAAREGRPVTVELQALPAVGLERHGRFVKATVRALAGRDGAIGGYLCSCVDVTEEYLREQTLRALMQEVTHRSKNMLSMVLSLASQTARTSASVAGFSRTLTGRVQSLAMSQNVITDSEWRGAAFRELVRVQVIDRVPSDTRGVTVSGDDLLFSPSAAIHVGLALHELIARAWQNGTLTGPGGAVSISCALARNEAGLPFASMQWEELFGPRGGLAQEPDGFSRAVLERVVPGAVKGEAQLSITEDRLRYRLTIDRSEIRTRMGRDAGV